MDDIQYKKKSRRMDSDRMLHLPNEDDLLLELASNWKNLESAEIKNL